MKVKDEEEGDFVSIDVVDKGKGLGLITAKNLARQMGEIFCWKAGRG